MLVDFATFNESLYSVGSGNGWRPIVDGDFIKNSPYYQFAHKQVAPIALIVGCNSDEGLTTFQKPANTSDELLADLEATMGVNSTMADELLALYPDGDQFPPYSQPMSLDWVNLTAQAGVYSGNLTRKGYAMGGDWSVSDNSPTTSRPHVDADAISYRPCRDVV